MANQIVKNIPSFLLNATRFAVGYRSMKSSFPAKLNSYPDAQVPHRHRNKIISQC